MAPGRLTLRCPSVHVCVCRRHAAKKTGFDRSKTRPYSSASTSAERPARVSPWLVLVRHGEPRLASAGFGEMWGAPSHLGQFIARLGGTLSRLGQFWRDAGNPILPRLVYSETWGPPSHLGRFWRRRGGDPVSPRLVYSETPGTPSRLGRF